MQSENKVRTRTSGGLASYNDLLLYVEGNNCSDTAYRLYSTGSTGVTFGEARRMTDFVTPHFARRMAAGEFIDNGMYSTYTQKKCTEGNYIIRTNANSCSSPVLKRTWTERGHSFIAGIKNALGEAYAFETRAPLGVSIQALNDEAWAEVLANRQRQGNANYIESLAEMDQLHHMVATPLENTRRFVTSFIATGKRKKGVRKWWAHGQEGFTFLSSEWLRFRYGIRPAISDVAAAMKAMEKGWPDKKIRVVSRAKRVANGSEIKTGTFNYDQITITYQVARNRTYSVRGYYYDLFKPTLWNSLGFNLQNILGVPWELLRYSFVVDWFANVGDVIYANLPRAGVTPLGGNLTSWDVVHNNAQPTSVSVTNPVNYTLLSAPSDTLDYLSITKQRGAPHSDTANLVLNQDFGLNGWKRATDAAALLLQQLHRIRFA